jgi:hypothetical protein
VDEAKLSEKWKIFVRNGTPVSAILIPAAFFTSILGPAAKEPNAFDQFSLCWIRCTSYHINLSWNRPGEKMIFKFARWQKIFCNSVFNP